MHTPLKAIADFYNTIPESNENNNQQTKDINVQTPQLPDLTITNIQVPDTVNNNAQTPVTITISNTGTTDAGPFTVKIYDGTTGIIWQTINNLAAGTTTTFTFNWTPTTLGTHTLKAIADFYNTIPESNENNNQQTKDINVQTPQLPDLTITNIQVPDTVNNNAQTPVTITISNTGTTDAGPFTVKIYDGTTGIIWQTINNLAAGTTTTFTFNLTPTTLGTHTLKAIADYYNTIPESNENNNQQTKDINVNN